MKPVKAWAYVEDGRISVSDTTKSVWGTYRRQPDIYMEPKGDADGFMPTEMRLVRVEIREVPLKPRKRVTR